MGSPDLQTQYRCTSENTLAVWAENKGAGKIREENYYDPVKLALAAGLRPAATSSVSRLLGELEQLTRDDPLADTLPAQGLHFTFLPLTLPLYHASEPLPAKVEQLKSIWTGFDGKKIAIRDLRLVALPSQLLLAGIPEHPAIALRQRFCEKVLDSDWRNELLMRHANSPLPAPFWHSTLLRYGAAFLPAPLRQFFMAYQSVNVGDIAGELMLAKVNYNWTTCYPLQPL